MLIEPQGVITHNPQPPRQRDVPERPSCFGSGQWAESGQRVPLGECRACPHVSPCAQLRLAQAAERDAEQQPRVPYWERLGYRSWEDHYAARMGVRSPRLS